MAFRRPQPLLVRICPSMSIVRLPANHTGLADRCGVRTVPSWPCWQFSQVFLGSSMAMLVAILASRFGHLGQGSPSSLRLAGPATLFLSCTEATDFIVARQAERVQDAGVLFGEVGLEVRRGEQGVARAGVRTAAGNGRA